jgi:hypothetical protein
MLRFPIVGAVASIVADLDWPRPRAGLAGANAVLFAFYPFLFFAMWVPGLGFVLLFGLPPCSRVLRGIAGGEAALARTAARAFGVGLLVTLGACCALPLLDVPRRASALDVDVVFGAALGAFAVAPLLVGAAAPTPRVVTWDTAPSVSGKSGADISAWWWGRRR